MTGARWIDVTDRATLAARRWMEVEAGPHALLLYDIDGQVFATSAICPHHAAWLSQGGFDGDHVDCPRHQGRFHIPTGTMVRGPTCEALRTYPAKTEDGRILVEID
jgi:nitrite reductase/ring-hydroxylating ferredoxin subunit